MTGGPPPKVGAWSFLLMCVMLVGSLGCLLVGHPIHVRCGQRKDITYEWWKSLRIVFLGFHDDWGQ